MAITITRQLADARQDDVPEPEGASEGDAEDAAMLQLALVQLSACVVAGDVLEFAALSGVCVMQGNRYVRWRASSQENTTTFWSSDC